MQIFLTYFCLVRWQWKGPKWAIVSILSEKRFQETFFTQYILQIYIFLWVWVEAVGQTFWWVFYINISIQTNCFRELELTVRLAITCEHNFTTDEHLLYVFVCFARRWFVPETGGQIYMYLHEINQFHVCNELALSLKRIFAETGKILLTSQWTEAAWQQIRENYWIATLWWPGHLLS